MVAPPLSSMPSEDWKILIVDNDAEVHDATTLVLADFVFENKPIEFIHAYSRTEAHEYFKQHANIALAIIGVAMEENNSGLELVEEVRMGLNNHYTRIILRTDQPSTVTHSQVIKAYDIDGYNEKTDTSNQNIHTLTYSALRAYRDICAIHQHKKALNKIVDSFSKTLRFTKKSDFTYSTIDEIFNLFSAVKSTFFYSQPSPTTQPQDKRHTQPKKHFQTLVCNGDLTQYNNVNSLSCLPVRILAKAETVLNTQRSQYFRKSYGYYFSTKNAYEHVVFIDFYNDPNHDEKQLLDVFLNNVSTAFENITAKEEIINGQNEILYFLMDAVETGRIASHTHAKQVVLYAEKFAQLYGLPESDISLLKHATPLHDIGMSIIPNSLVNDEKKLSSDDKKIIQQHCEYGHVVLCKSSNIILQTAANIALQHHEHWDGLGYPYGLKNKEISLFSRIVNLADTFDALTCSRSYRSAWPKEDIRQHFISNTGKQFDPALSKLLLDNFEDFFSLASTENEHFIH